LETDFQKIVEDAITRTALKPPPVFDPEVAANEAIELFNGGAEALERGFKHRFGPFLRFGLRLEVAAKSIRRVKGGEEDFVPERHIVLRSRFRDAWSQAIVLLQIAINENRTFTITTPDKPIRELSKSELGEMAAARAYLAKSEEEKIALVTEALKNKEAPRIYNAGQGETLTYPPEISHWMLNFLLMMRMPKRAIEYQAGSADGWWHRKGRQRKAGKQAMSRLFDIQERLARAELKYEQRVKRLNSIPTAGGMVPPGWPQHRSRDGLHIPSRPVKRSGGKMYGDKGWKDPLPKGKIYRDIGWQSHKDAKLVGVHSVDQPKKLMTEKKLWPRFKDRPKPKK
jgi:hypothetical protein